MSFPHDAGAAEGMPRIPAQHAVPPSHMPYSQSQVPPQGVPFQQMPLHHMLGMQASPQQQQQQQQASHGYAPYPVPSGAASLPSSEMASIVPLSQQRHRLSVANAGITSVPQQSIESPHVQQQQVLLPPSPGIPKPHSLATPSLPPQPHHHHPQQQQQQLQPPPRRISASDAGPQSNMVASQSHGAPMVGSPAHHRSSLFNTAAVPGSGSGSPHPPAHSLQPRFPHATMTGATASSAACANAAPPTHDSQQQHQLQQSAPPPPHAHPHLQPQHQQQRQSHVNRLTTTAQVHAAPITYPPLAHRAAPPAPPYSTAPLPTHTTGTIPGQPRQQQQQQAPQPHHPQRQQLYTHQSQQPRRTSGAHAHAFAAAPAYPAAYGPAPAAAAAAPSLPRHQQQQQQQWQQPLQQQRQPQPAAPAQSHPHGPPYHLLPAAPSSGGVESLASFTGMLPPPPPSAPSPAVPSSPPAATASQTTFLSSPPSRASGDGAVVDAEDMRQADERPFRFKMLPPPPIFEGFVSMWETNAPDRRPSDHTTCVGNATATGTSTSSSSSSSGSQSSYTGSSSARGRLAVDADSAGFWPLTTMAPPAAAGAGSSRAASDFGSASALGEEEHVAESTAPSKMGATVAGTATDPERDSGSDASERARMATQYRLVLERWWTYMSVFEAKAEVRQRLGDVGPCPSLADAQRTLAAAPAVAEEEAVLGVWSTLVLQWWQETKRRRRARRTRHATERPGGVSPRPTRRRDSSGSGSDGNAGAHARAFRTRATTSSSSSVAPSLASVNSFALPSDSDDGSARLYHSPPVPDHEAVLHFDFSTHSSVSSPPDN